MEGGENMNIKKFLAGTAVGALMLVSTAVPAFASPAAPNAQCGTGASSGAFLMGEYNYGDYLSHGGTPVYHDGAVGQDAGATGYNNSQVCGNTP